MTLTPDDILTRASNGDLTQQQQDAVAASLLSEGPAIDRYTLLLALGRAMATSIAGEYLRNAKHPELLCRLMTIVNDETEDECMRKDAYVSLARAMRAEWTELPPLSRLPPLAEIAEHEDHGGCACQART